MTEPIEIRAIDANVLLRYYLDDVPNQAAQARKLIESEEILGVTAVALAEFAWTLCGVNHRRPRVQVAEFLVNLLSRENLITIGMNKAEVQAALLTCTLSTGAPNFGDALIAACARSAGLFEIYTFDANFERAGLRAVPIP